MLGANEVRDCEAFKVNFARTRQYQNSAIPYCQKLLNEYACEKRADERVAAGAGQEQGAGAAGLQISSIRSSGT